MNYFFLGGFLMFLSWAQAVFATAHGATPSKGQDIRMGILFYSGVASIVVGFVLLAIGAPVQLPGQS